MIATEMDNNKVGNDNSGKLSRLTVFTFLWACQALTHQEFFRQWLFEGRLLGWILTTSIAATLLFPRSLWPLSVFLFSSILHNFTRWPFVANHILLESLVHITILISILLAFLEHRKNLIDAWTFRESIFLRFAPVVGVMVIMMYSLQIL